MIGIAASARVRHRDRGPYGRITHLQPMVWPNLLLQKLPAPAFTATTKVTMRPGDTGETAGLVVMGMDYASLAVRHATEGFEVVHARARDAHEGKAEETALPVPIRGSTVYFRVSVREGAVCQFSYSVDGVEFVSIGDEFQAREGRWIGAKVGLFALRPTASRAGGYADFDCFRIQ